MIVLLLVGAVSVAVGYALGRARPYTRLADWTNWQLRFHLDRWTPTRLRQAALFALLLLTDPIKTASAWRRRHEPKPQRAPAPEFRTRDEDPS